MSNESNKSNIDQCAGCQNHLTEYYETVYMECKRFYPDRYDDGLEDDEEL